MSVTLTETNGHEITRWIGDVRDVGRDSFFALLYPDEAAFAKRWDAADVEISRQELPSELWRCIQACTVFHCDVVLDTSVPTEEQPALHAVKGVEFDPGFSERMNEIALASLQCVSRR